MAIAAALTTFQFNGVTVYGVGSVAVSTVRNPLDITEIGANNAYFVDGVQTTTCVLDLFYDKSFHQDLMDNIMDSSGPLFTKVLWKNVAGQEDFVTGCARVSQFDTVSGANDVCRASVTLVFDGFVERNGTVTYPGANEVAPTAPITTCPAVGGGGE